MTHYDSESHEVITFSSVRNEDMHTTCGLVTSVVIRTRHVHCLLKELASRSFPTYE
jgi:hypothetical protein